MSESAPELPFDLRSLEIFLAVCQAGSMAAAAKTLAITQPAISLAVADLERRTGTELFDRRVRPLALTAAGGLLRQRAVALIADAREIPELLRRSAQGQIPLLRVGLVDSVGRALSTPIAEFLAARAEAVSVLAGLTAAHANALLTRRLDIYVGVDDLDEAPGLERWELLKEPYVLLLPRAHPQVRTLTALRRLAETTPFVRYSARSQTGVEIERHLRRLGLAPPSWCEFDTPFGVASMVAAGDAFAITTPLCIFEARMPPGRVVATPLPGPRISRTLTMVARQREFGNTPRDLAAEMSRRLGEPVAAILAALG